LVRAALRVIFISSESALQVADDALKSATKAEQKTSEDVDKRFEMAINALSEYERRQHSRETVHKVMAEAKARDKSSVTVLDRLKEKFRVREELAPLLRRILIPIPSQLRMY